MAIRSLPYSRSAEMVCFAWPTTISGPHSAAGTRFQPFFALAAIWKTGRQPRSATQPHDDVQDLAAVRPTQSVGQAIALVPTGIPLCVGAGAKIVGDERQVIEQTLPVPAPGLCATFHFGLRVSDFGFDIGSLVSRENRLWHPPDCGMQPCPYGGVVARP
jgi:hypothetical protein